MANFCTKCGQRLGADGLCPACDAPKTPNFCMKCGQRLGADGLCPACDAPKTFGFCTRCGRPLGADGQCPLCNAPEPVAVATAVTVAEPVVEPVAEPVTAPRFCVCCGTTMDGDAGVCPVCGVGGDAPVMTDDVAGVYNPPTPETAQPPKKKKHHAVTIVITVLLSFCLFITTTLWVGVLTARHIISENGASQLVEELDVASLLKNVGAAQQDSFEEFYKRMERDYDVKLDDETLAELLEESTIPDFVGDKVGDFSEDLFEGKADLTITKEEMVELVEDNRELIEEQMGDEYAHLSNSDCQQIADWIFNGDEMVILQSDDIAKTAAPAYYAITIGLSYITLGFFLLLSALIVFLLCRNSLSQAAIGIGVVFTFLGGVTALAAAIVEWIPTLWAAIVGGNPILSLVGSLLTVNAAVFGILLGVGVLLFIIRALVIRFWPHKA